MNPLIIECIKTLGIANNTTSHSEKYTSAIGVFISVTCCYGITQYSLSPDNTQLYIASMAASAFLLFAIPHGALSQPWPLIMGHIVSAVIGVSCYQYLGSALISTGLAVSLSVLLMYYLSCLHPPGAATAFFVVTAGEDVHALGFSFIWLVIMTNVLCLLVIAVVFNGLFHWRRYPAHLFQMPTSEETRVDQLGFSQEDLTSALTKVNSFVDVTPDDLASIFEHAVQHAQENRQKIKTIEVGKFYSNGLIGHNWRVYEVLSCEKGKVLTHTVAGKHDGHPNKEWRLREFKRAAQQEVKAQGQHWVRPNNIIANA
jgi:CBS domain-containing membrane protein